MKKYYRKIGEFPVPDSNNLKISLPSVQYSTLAILRPKENQIGRYIASTPPYKQSDKNFFFFEIYTDLIWKP